MPVPLLAAAIAVPTLVLAFLVIRGIANPKRIERLQVLVEAKRWSYAVKLGRQLLERDAANMEVRFLLAQAYRGDGRDDLAFIEMKTILRAGRFGGRVKEAAFHREMAELFEKFDQAVEALKEYLLLVKLEPDNAGHYHKIGRIFQNRHKSDHAKAYFQKALKLDSRHIGAKIGLGVLLYQDKHSAEAATMLEEAAPRSDDPELHFYLGRIRREARDNSAALRAFGVAAKSETYRRRALMERAVTFIQQSEPDQAISDLKTALDGADEKSVETAHALYLMAHCYESLRMLDRALPLWSRVETIRPGYRDVPDKLEAYSGVQTDDSVKDYLTASPDEFAEICLSITTGMNLSVRESTPIRNGFQVIAFDAPSEFRNTRQHGRIIQYYRVPKPVSDEAIRSIVELMREERVQRAVAVSSSGFTHQAETFASTRPITLVSIDELPTLLKQHRLPDESG